MTAAPDSAQPKGGRVAPSSAQTCTYGYDCRAQAEAGGTMIRVFDVSSPAAPRELRSYELSVGASRRVGNFVYTVVSDHDLATPTLLHKTVIGTRGSASDAPTNHLAFNDGTYGSELVFSGLMLFDVSLESGIVIGLSDDTYKVAATTAAGTVLKTIPLSP